MIKCNDELDFERMFKLSFNLSIELNRKNELLKEEISQFKTKIGIINENASCPV